MDARELLQSLDGYVRVAKVTEDRISVYCPFHKGGMERNPSMSIYPKSGRVVCFTCQYRAPIHRFLEDRGMEPETAKKYREIVRSFEPESAERDPNRSLSLAAWLGFFQKYIPKNLLELGFKRETLDRFGVGYDTRTGRVTYPIQDRYGNLVAIVGGAVDPNDFPKYKLFDTEIGLPRATRQDHRNHLWGYHLLPKSGPIIIAEGYKATMWLAQHGLPACATQGVNYTRPQIDLLVEVCRPTWIMFDNDDAGRAATERLQEELVSRIGGYAMRVAYPRDDAKQPDQLSADELSVLRKELER